MPLNCALTGLIFYHSCRTNFNYNLFFACWPLNFLFLSLPEHSFKSVQCKKCVPNSTKADQKTDPARNIDKKEVMLLMMLFVFCLFFTKNAVISYFWICVSTLRFSKGLESIQTCCKMRTPLAIIFIIIF